LQIAIISTGLAIVLFLCLYLGFRTGLRLGMQTAKGHIPSKIEPFKAVKEAIIPPKPDEFTANLLAGHARMMEYDGFLPEEKR
jgi:hypothetical protein